MNKISILLTGLCLVSPVAVPAPVFRAPALPAGERVSFASLDGDLSGGAATRIDALVFRPAGPGPFPAVVALHGASGLVGKAGPFSNYLAWGNRLREEGFLAIFPDSFNPRGLKGGIATLRQDPVPPGRERVRDVYGALRYLQARSDVRPDRIGLLGWSHGGSTVLASVDAGQPFRPPAPERNFRVAVAFYPGSWRQLRQPSWRPAMPLTILVGASDDWTPAEGCVTLGQRARAAGAAMEVVTYPGAYHGFDAPGEPVHVRLAVHSKTGRATVGTNPEARQEALARCFKLFHQALDF
ncbi:MAG: dienelactone hydrolase family protein [Holophaga sp.]|nr:dienelactone hydrolase family protein [Holophaga sp.]